MTFEQLKNKGIFYTFEDDVMGNCICYAATEDKSHQLKIIVGVETDKGFSHYGESIDYSDCNESRINKSLDSLFSLAYNKLLYSEYYTINWTPKIK